jgi:hypothetical protein
MSVMLEMPWLSAGIIIGLLYKNTKIFTTDPIKQWGAEIRLGTPSTAQAFASVIFY